MKIAFYASNIVPIHAKSLTERPLGGVETGLIYLSECLASLGHEVTVFTPLENPPESKPRYLSHKAIESHGPVDAFISVRDWIPVLYRLSAKTRFFWTGDSYDQFPNFGMGDKRLAQSINAFLAVSEWHANTLCEASGFPRSKTWILRNGVNLSLFEGEEKRVRKRLIYSSTPYRGLQYVPALYRELKKKHPDLELHVFSGYAVYNQAPQSFEVLQKELAQLPDCTLHGNTLQKDLSREFMKSSILFYPCDFEETSCITAMEAQAAGCVSLSTKLGALPETIGDAGVLIEGRAGSPEYAKAFLEAADSLLSNDALFAKYSARAKERAKEFSWLGIAQRFEEFVSQLIKAQK